MELPSLVDRTDIHGSSVLQAQESLLTTISGSIHHWSIDP